MPHPAACALPPLLSPPIRGHPKHENFIRDLDFLKINIGWDLSNTHVVAAAVVVVVVVVHTFVYICLSFFCFFLVSALVSAFWFAAAYGRWHVFVCVCVWLCCSVRFNALAACLPSVPVLQQTKRHTRGQTRGRKP